MSSLNQFLLLSGLLVVPNDVVSFTIPSRQRSQAFGVRRAARAKSSLHALAPTADYLSSLSSVAERPNTLATSEYLSSLSQIADASAGVDPTTVSPEAFLTDMSSQLLEASLPSSPVFDAGSFSLADGEMMDMMDSSGAEEVFDASTSTPVADGLADPSTVQEAAGDVADSLKSQLSELSYGSYADGSFEEKASEAPSIAESITDSITESLKSTLSGNPYDSLVESYQSRNVEGPNLGEALDSSMEKMGNLFGSVTSSLGDIAEAGANSAKVLGKAMEVGAGHVADAASASANAVGGAVDTALSVPRAVAGVSDRVAHAGDNSLVDVGNAVVGGIKFMGTILVQLIDAFLSILVGTSVGSILEGVQASVQSVIDGATNSVANTIYGIGDMTVKEVLETLVALVISVSKILLTLVNAVVKLLSGYEATEWAVAAGNAVTQEANQLTAQASATVNDLTHQSLNDLSNSIGDFSVQVGNELYANIGSLNDVVTSEGVPLNEAMDTLTTAMQSSLFN